MKKILRRLYSFSPNSIRLAYGKRWRFRGRVDRMFMSGAKVDAELAKANVFFLIGSGRCGTLLISSLLNKDKMAIVLHEPHRHSDLHVRPKCRSNPEFAERYVQQFRKYEIYKKMRDAGVETYGEVSQPLRCLGQALRRVIPTATYMILVRDGRDVVRSALNRQHGRSKMNHAAVVPLPGDPYAAKWDSLTDFEKMCWWWMDSYRMLLEHLPGVPIIHFEKVTKSWEYVRDNIVEPLGLNITEQIYRDHLAKPTKNAAMQYVIPHWSEWSEEQKSTFDRVCGDWMRRLGYDYSWTETPRATATRMAAPPSTAPAPGGAMTATRA